MLYVSKLIKNENRRDEYPFTVPVIAQMDELVFEQPITILCGDNGCGKSTLMEILAAKLDAIRIGQGIIERGGVVARHVDAFTLWKRAAKTNFFFSAEDFIAYISWVSRAKQEARDEIRRIDQEGIGDLDYAKMPHYHTLADLEGLYAGNLAKQSHGEGFLDFFQSRIRSGGLYLLDEPEGALSYENQYALAIAILDAVQNKCQFILATHSPILSAIPGADIVEVSGQGMERCAYDDLNSIRFLKLFMERKSRLFEGY